MLIVVDCDLAKSNMNSMHMNVHDTKLIWVNIINVGWHELKLIYMKMVGYVKTLSRICYLKKTLINVWEWFLQETFLTN